MLKSTIDRAAGSSPWRRLGKIKLGIKVKTDRGEYPKDLDYFVMPEKYKALLGDQPRELAIILPHSTLEENFTSKCKMYLSNGACACRSDDEVTAERWLPVVEGSPKREWKKIPCPGPVCEFRLNKKAAARGYLNVMVPAVGEVGTFALIFGSQVAQGRILKALEVVELLTQGRPKGMAGIRMMLRREPVEFFKDLKGDGIQAKIVKYLPSLEIDFKALLREDYNLLAPFFGKSLVALPSSPQVLDGELELDDEDDGHGRPKEPGQDDDIPFDGSKPGGRA
jgi:hypothetical protein